MPRSNMHLLNLASCTFASHLCYIQVVASVDIAFLDACFFDATELPGRDMSKVPHPLITDTMQRLKGVAGAQHEVVLVHMNHTNPVWREEGEQRAAVVQAGLCVGAQGTAYEL